MMTLVRLARMLMRVEYPISHPPSMEEERFKSKMNTLQLNQGIFRLLGFRVRKNSKVNRTLVGAILGWVTYWEV